MCGFKKEFDVRYAGNGLRTDVCMNRFLVTVRCSILYWQSRRVDDLVCAPYICRRDLFEFHVGVVEVVVAAARSGKQTGCPGID